MCFYANLGRHFLKSNNVGRHFCPDFQQIKTLGVALATHAPPAPTPLHRLETNLLQLFQNPESSE